MICPASASPKIHQMSVAEVLALLRRYGPLLSGITVSGGGGDHPAAIRDRPVHGHQEGAGSGPPQLPARQQRFPRRDRLAAAAAGAGRRHDRPQGVASAGAPYPDWAWPGSVLASLRLLAAGGKLPSCACSMCRGRATFSTAAGELAEGWRPSWRRWAPCPSASTAFAITGCAGRRWPGRSRVGNNLVAGHRLEGQGFGPVMLPAI